MVSVMFGRLAGAVRNFRRARGGNVAITFAFACLPVIGLVGAGLDYSRASRIRTVLQAAADAAAVGSVAKASNAYAAAQNMANDGSIAAGQTQATNIFNAEISGRSGFSVTNLTATVNKSNWQVTSSVRFAATVPTVLMQVLGWSNLTVTGSSAAANGMPTYIDFYLLLDNTPSMGLGATQADINNLNSLTGCAFGCHDISGAENYYAVARSNNIKMRIDVVASAASQLMTTATNTQVVSNQFRMAIYTPGTWGSTSSPSDVAKQATNNYAPNRVQALTTNLSNAATAAAQIDLMSVNHNNENNDRATNYDVLMPGMSALIPNPGNGQSSSSRQAVLFMVTDGLADEVSPTVCSGTSISGQSRCIEPINTSLCTDIKSRGIRIAVLYTTYLLPNSDSWSNTNVVPLLPSISPAMQSCASPGLFYEVSPTQGIADAMNALFQKAVATARLTQ